MSNKLIRKALETRLAALPTLPAIAYENINFQPATENPFVETTMLFAEPDDVGFKDSAYIQRGFMQVALFYPTNQGPGKAEAMAELVRNWFKRGSTFQAENVVAKIEKTPEVSGGAVEESRFVIRTTVRFSATIEQN